RVFVALDTSLGRKVVVKLLLPELAATVNVDRFRREIHLAAMLQHPHIVPVLSAGVSDGLPYYTMPFIDGESLRARLARVGKLDVAEATKILRDVLSALSYAHEQGVVHRDIKPENILLSGPFAVVTDFGVAKALSASTNPNASITTAGVVLGTPAYMAPEQAAGDPSMDHRADIYSVGVVAYEMFSGERLFADRPAHAIFAAHAIDVPAPLSEKTRRVPPGLAALVARCLEKDPARRPQTEQEVMRELDVIASGGGGGGLWRPRRLGSGGTGGRRWLLGLLGAAVALALIYAGYRATRERLASGAIGAQPPAQLAIAVLPFANMSGVRENEYFSDGMTEELIHALGTVKGLEVAARTSSFAFKDKEATVQEIGQRLHVSHVLEGSVRQSGTRLRVTAELIDAKNGFRIWSQSYDRQPKDIFQVQDEISQSIVSALSSTLGSSATTAAARKTTRDLIAHDLYLKGDFFWNKRTSDGLQTAAKYFEQAIARDSTYALAYAGLADSYAVIAAFGYLEPKRTYALAKPAALRALALDSTLAEAHTSLGFIHLYYDLDSAAARREFVRALSLDPRYAVAHLFDAWYYLAGERLPEAISEATTARDLEPLSLIINTRLGTMLRYAERYDEAERQLRKTLELDANFSIGYDEMARLMASKGNFPQAVANARRAVDLNYVHGDGILGYSLAMSGDKAGARRILDGLIAKSKSEYIAPFDIGMIYVGLGDDSAAITWLARCKEVRDHEAPHLRRDPLLKRLRRDPRFVAITSGVL
ncbi:MAG: eukaryotic-like serine/threonine-protein kinase, partial [Gemmatimonadaceae bacterium]|nr:eukaryotic-like serine/threonine-protein kinase [Gemmatimonadaceae bacterium]